MLNVRTLDALRVALAGFRAAGERVALVPTMGALHAGHMALVAEAAKLADHVVASIFVNPKQFGPNEDLDAYPRREAADAAMLEAAGVAILWAPTADAMYPDGYATTVSVAGVSGGLCGAVRPGHFDGVATVVALLLNLTRADRAYFGEKDWQQLQVVRQMVADLRMPVRIVACPSVRAEDGVALSSRNQRLSPDARRRAAAIPQALAAAARAIEGGAAPEPVLEDARATLRDAGLGPLDYLELRDALSLAEPRPGHEARLLVAVWLDGVRLIDNVPVRLAS